MKVILYILRHTWGYHDDCKRISVDEFCNGRKRKGGERLDAGTGLSEPTVRDGLARAEAHGFITVEVDDSDLGRIQKFYSLRMTDEPEEIVASGVKSFAPSTKEVLPRTKKDTLERNLEKITPTADATRPGDPPVTFSGWREMIRESKNRPALLRWMFMTLYSDSDAPDFGYIGKAARTVGGASRLAELMWQHCTRPPSGDVLRYLMAVARNQKFDRANGKNGNDDNGRDTWHEKDGRKVIRLAV